MGTHRPIAKNVVVTVAVADGEIYTAVVDDGESSTMTNVNRH